MKVRCCGMHDLQVCLLTDIIVLCFINVWHDAFVFVQDVVEKDQQPCEHWSLYCVCAVCLRALTCQEVRWCSCYMGGAFGSGGEGNDPLTYGGYAVTHFRTVMKCNNANQQSVIYGMMREMIYDSFTPYWTCRGLETIVGRVNVWGWNPSGARYFLFAILIHTSRGARLASCTMSTRSLSWGWSGWVWCWPPTWSGAKVKN